MKNMLTITAILAVFVVGSGSESHGADQLQYLVPAVARVPGEAGSLWRSDLVLHNPGSVPATATLQYIERDQANPSPAERTLSIEPGVSVLSEDILLTVFDVGEGAGALLIVCDQPVVISSRTFNLTADTDGTATTWGQFVPGVPVASFAATALNLLPQLTNNAVFRTNLGIVNLGYDELLAWVAAKVFDGEGPKARMYRVPANGMSQINGLLGETGEPIDDAMISTDTDFLSGPYLAWASVVDNQTGDAIFVPPITPLGEQVYIPAAAHTEGLNGSVWRTDLEVTGDPHLPVSYRLEWLPADIDNSNPTGIDFTLEPGQARRHHDVVGTDLGATGVGALRVHMIVGHALITSRTYTVTEAGSFGQFVGGQPAAAAVLFGGESVLVHLRQSPDESAGYRSNVGVVNTSATTIDVVVDIHDSAGAFLTTVSFAVPPFSMHQVNHILRGLRPTGIDLASARISTTTEGGSLLAYVSVIDNRSNDPIFVPGQVTLTRHQAAVHPLERLQDIGLGPRPAVTPREMEIRQVNDPVWRHPGSVAPACTGTRTSMPIIGQMNMTKMATTTISSKLAGMPALKNSADENCLLS